MGPVTDPLARVAAASLAPAEIPTPLAFLKQADCYQQVGIKYPQRGTYHSYAELLHFALAEGDATVTTFIPQPFRLQIIGKPYVPDAYLVRAGQRVVVELKPRGEFDAERRQLLEAFCAFHGMQFVVLANEAMYAREVEALNWLHLVRALATASAVTSAAEERELWQRLHSHEELALGELLDVGDRVHGFAREVALYRLLHRGQVRADWQRQRLGPATVLFPCA